MPGKTTAGTSFSCWWAFCDGVRSVGILPVGAMKTERCSACGVPESITNSAELSVSGVWFRGRLWPPRFLASPDPLVTLSTGGRFCSIRRFVNRRTGRLRRFPGTSDGPPWTAIGGLGHRKYPPRRIAARLPGQSCFIWKNPPWYLSY